MQTTAKTNAITTLWWEGAHYDKALKNLKQLQVPERQPNSTHVFHQYTLQVKDGQRDALQNYLKDRGIPTMIYYPVPLYEQEAFKNTNENQVKFLPVTDQLCKSVISLPIHTELDQNTLDYITQTIISFFE